MGNLLSSNTNKSQEKEFAHFYNVIDYIATYYILTMDFKSLQKLSEKEYCNNLVVLTSDIIDKYFNEMEVTYLEQRIKNGIEVNELTTEKVLYLNREKLDDLDISNDEKKNIRKKRVCIGIAKYYVKIAHIFAAILMTINPVYSYKDAEGNLVKIPFMEKDKIPKNVKRTLNKLNICDERINALKRGEETDDVTGNVRLHPKVCDMNINNANGEVKTLADEPGISELMQLYLDDEYDYSNGTFTGMKESTKADFMNDLRRFYNTFTDKNPGEPLPPNITKFSDIKLTDYKSQKGCSGVSPVLNQTYVMKQSDDLFIKYAKNTRKMLQTATDNQTKLLSIINDLFTYDKEAYSSKKIIRVNPTLTDTLLQEAIKKTRNYISDLYITCEQDYVNGLKIYAAIVEKKIAETTQRQIDTLTKKKELLIKETQRALENKKPAVII
jgi:hypothetical protein